jgi:Ca-activated chloride channel family protein
MWSVTDATRVAAQRWIGELDANLSGTEMAAALESTFALGRNEPADVLIITDGEINAIDSTLETARASGHRLFVVGIGSSPAEIHLRRLADATGGACDFVAPGEAVEPAVLRMFARLRSPRLTGLAIEWPDDIRPAWMAPLPTAVFDGDTVNVFAWLPAMPRGEVRLLGTRDKSAAPQAIGCVRFGPSVEASDTLSRMAASERLRSLPDEATREKSAESVRLALAYELVTEHTNFLLVHARAVGEKATDMPDLRTVAQMVPAGWGGIGTAALAGRGANVGMPLMSAPLDAGPPLAPVVRYQRRALHATVAMPDDCFDSLDIPTFLRRMPIDAVPSSPMQPSMDRIDPGIVREPRADEDPTPAALHRWLAATASMVWPRTYLELRRANVAPEVVDWLEYGIASGQGRLSEQVIVRTFLYVMSRWVFFADASKTMNPKVAVASMRMGIANVPDQAEGLIDLQLLEELVSALCTTSELQWPLCVVGRTPDRADHDRIADAIGEAE